MKRKAKERLDAAKARAATLAKAVGHGMKASAIEGATGAAAFYIARAAADNIDTLKKPYYLPAVLFVGGHLIGRKVRFHNTGVALKAIAGFLGAQQWDAERQQKAQQAQAGTPAQQIGKVLGQTQGYGESVGGIDDPGWRAMVGTGNAGAMGSPELPQAVYPPMSTESIGGGNAMGLSGGSSEAMGLVDG